MKYNVLPIPKKLTEEELSDTLLRKSYNELKREISTCLAKLQKKKKDHYKDILYLYDDTDMYLLKNLLKEEDEIIIHAEGMPFLIGLEQPSEYDLSALKLAKRLNDCNLPDISININLLACNSASEYLEFNFAKNCSEALSFFFGYKNISLTGYTGMIKVNSNAKYTVSSMADTDKKGTHSKLEDASMIYENGNLIKKGKILCSFNRQHFKGVQCYITAARHEKAEMLSKLKESNEPRHLSPELNQAQSSLFFSTPTNVRFNENVSEDTGSQLNFTDIG